VIIAYIVCTAVLALCALQIVQALRTGKVGFVFGPERRTREDNPRIFWSVVAFWILVIAYFLYRMATL